MPRKRGWAFATLVHSVKPFPTTSRSQESGGTEGDKTQSVEPPGQSLSLALTEVFLNQLNSFVQRCYAFGRVSVLGRN